MMYKRITLSRNKRKGLFFSEENLPHDRYDEGEFIFMNTASIYLDSDSKVWKNKMIAQFKKETEQEIEKLKGMLSDLETLNGGLK